MKLLFILKSMAQKAGTERVFSDKINWLANHGHDVILVTYEQGDHPLSYRLHPQVVVEDLDTRFFKLGQYNYLRRLLELHKMQKVFAERLQVVVEEKQPNVIITTTYSLKIVNQILSVNTSAEFIIESHSACFSVGKEFDFRHNIFFRSLFVFFDKYYLRRVNRFDLMIVLTNGDYQDWKRYINNVKIIPNPLTYYPENLPLKSLQNRIICVGRLTYQKGFDLLIKAYAKIFQRFPQWHIDIFGDGEDRDMIQSMINSYGMTDCIHLCGSTDSIYDNYIGSDFFVFSSRFEGFGLVLIEAMSCACPCVSFRCKYGPEDIIEDGVSGLLVKDGDVDELADKMAWIISHEKERINMGKKAREVASHYKLETIMQKWENAYLSVL